MTEREKAILNYIKEYKARFDGLSPTMREICEATGITTTSLVNYYLSNLQDQGRIKLLKGKISRGIMVVGGNWSMGRAA